MVEPLCAQTDFEVIPASVSAHIPADQAPKTAGDKMSGTYVLAPTITHDARTPYTITKRIKKSFNPAVPQLPACTAWPVCSLGRTCGTHHWISTLHYQVPDPAEASAAA